MASVNQQTPKQFRKMVREQEIFVTYEMQRKSRSGKVTTHSEVKRVCINGAVTGWMVGHFAKRTGRIFNGVKISYEQEREGYYRDGTVQQRPGHVRSGDSSFARVVELPEKATNIQCFPDQLPPQYLNGKEFLRCSVPAILVLCK